MSRRLTAAAALAVLGVALCPALPALAAETSTASLTAGSAVYPGADRSFTLHVVNNEAMFLGKTINAIRVNLPVNEAGIRLGSTPGTAAGFTGTKTDLGTTQFLTYRGGSLAPGSSVDISFPATVGSPQARDLLGDFRVQVSSDDFKTASTSSAASAGALTAKVQVLEILQDGLKPLGPVSGSKGVTDRTGTAGQQITYGTTVKNYAQSALSVTAGLTSSAGDTSTPTTFSVPAGQSASTSIPVKLGPAAADRSSVFTSTATASGATAPTKVDTFTVQAPATLALSGLQPTRTKSGTGSGRTFTVSAAKTGSQALDVTSSTLTIGSNTAPVGTAPSFAKGAASGTLSYAFPTINGTDGNLAASATSAATDDNLATYTYDAGLGNIVVDNLAPVLSVAVALPKDADGRTQTAVKNGDTVTVSGTITNAADLDANTLKVVLQPDVGPAQTVPVTLSGTGDSRTYTGSLKTAAFDKNATSFVANATAADTANNSGGKLSPSTVVDNVVPALAPSGTVLNANEVEVTFLDATGAFGGCNASAYTLDGVPGSVTAVRTSDGKDCATSGSGGRILTLRNPVAVDATPQVTYNYSASARSLRPNPAKDGAGNDALQQTVSTVSTLVPLDPTLTSVERRDGAPGAAFEPAYLDTAEKAYYTNVGGTDALQVTVGGIRQNYTLQVLRAGAVVASKKFTDAPAPLASDYTGSILVPLPTTPATSALTLRFVALNGRASTGLPLTVVLDQTRPALGTPTVTRGASDSTVAVPFSEKIVSGSDFADDWFVSETVDTETGTARRTVNANSVTADGQTGRTLTATFADASRFAGVDYYLQSPSGARYEDRAGNTLLNTLPAS